MGRKGAWAVLAAVVMAGCGGEPAEVDPLTAPLKAGGEGMIVGAGPDVMVFAKEPEKTAREKGKNPFSNVMVGTKLRIVEDHSGRYGYVRVAVLEGEHSGYSGWTFRRAVRPLD